MDIMLEQPKPLSQSMIWELQRRYFLQKGPSAWSNSEVPHYITSNPFTAHALAKLIIGFYRDLKAKHTYMPDSPIYILELGTGSGRFSYHLLRELQDMCQQASFPEFPFTYIMSDFADSNIEFWHKHASLKPFIEQGILDFAKFDIAAEQNEIQLLISGQVISKDSKHAPVVVIANYLFDSIPQDVFAVREGKLYECCITISTTDPVENMEDPSILSHINYHYECQRHVDSTYYAHPIFDVILQSYQNALTDTIFTFPLVALACMTRLKEVFGGDLLLITADKGEHLNDGPPSNRYPGIMSHGSISMGINFHALEAFFQLHEGTALHTSHAHGYIQVAAYVWGTQSNYAETKLAYHLAIEQFGPDDYYLLRAGLKPHYSTLSNKQLLSLAKFTYWDYKTFLGYFPELLSRVEDDNFPTVDWKAAVERIWRHYYPIGEQDDLAFQLGVLLYAMGCFQEAIRYFEHSLDLYGPSPDTYLNLGLSYYYLGDTVQSEEFFNQSQALRIE